MWHCLLLSLFLLGVLGGALFSAPIHCASRWLRQVKPSLAHGLDVVVALLGLPAFNASLLFVLPVCFVGARMARARENRAHSFLFYFTRILGGASLALILLVVASLALPALLPVPYSVLTTLSDHYLTQEVEVIMLWVGTFTGLALAPAVIDLRAPSAPVRSQSAARV